MVFKFSFEYPADKNVAGLRKIADKIEKIETPDDKTVVFTLKNSDINFARDGLSVMRIICKDVYDGVKDPTTVKESIGSGMYKLTEYKTGEYYKLEAVEDYFRGTPQVSKINMPIVTDATAVQQGILSGEFAAATSSIGVEVVDTFKNTSGLTVYANDGYAPTILNFNNGEKALQDVKFRQALSYAIDVNDICKTLYGDYAAVGTRGLIRSDMEYAVGGLEYVHDTEKAAQLLDELGYTKTNGDGYRLDKDGKVLDFDILTYSGNTIRARIAELDAEDLKEVGIKATVKSMEMDTVDAYVWPDFEVSKGRDYDMSTWGWSSSNTPSFLVSLCSSDYSIGTYNVMGYKSDKFDQIVTEQYDKVTTMEQMTSMLEELQNVVAEEIPCLVIAYPDSLQVCNTDQYNGWESGKGLNVVNVFSFLNE
ncbi:MAG: ABC transporter substrate-binding protein [Oscillospiraceae bacterium]|nr:ABC transporter substrate-binding protein [Oscillospiraceae bacterium]